MRWSRGCFPRRWKCPGSILLGLRLKDGVRGKVVAAEGQRFQRLPRPAIAIDAMAAVRVVSRAGWKHARPAGSIYVYLCMNEIERTTKCGVDRMVGSGGEWMNELGCERPEPSLQDGSGPLWRRSSLPRGQRLDSGRTLTSL